MAFHLGLVRGQLVFDGRYPPWQGGDLLIQPLDLAVYFLQRFQLFQVRMHAGSCGELL